MSRFVVPLGSLATLVNSKMQGVKDEVRSGDRDSGWSKLRSHSDSSRLEIESRPSSIRDMIMSTSSMSRHDSRSPSTESTASVYDFSHVFWYFLMAAGKRGFREI